MVASRHDIQGQIDVLLGEVKREIDVSRRSRIFCNRNLRMDRISLIGFDMDYTLALYNQEQLSQLSIDLTLQKMVSNHGYSEEIKHLHYDSNYAIRGIVVDCLLGNVFKMNRHTHVGRVYHGKRPLSSAERSAAYRQSRIRLSSKRYHWIDTLFGLPEAIMYITLVDYFDARATGPNYRELYENIRASIDEAHRDDTLKKVIRADLNAYVVKDFKLAETLHKLRSSGKRLFLLTNSYWSYTNHVMSHLLDGERNAYPSWRNYFDFVLVGGGKPGFFNERRPFVGIHPETGETLPSPVTQLHRDGVYQGGNVFDFEEMTGVGGEGVLYVGDHIYGDILRLKKEHLWRTALVLQELDAENRTSERLEQQIADLGLLDRRHRNLESEIDYQVLMLKQIQRLTVGAAEPIRPELETARRAAKKTLDALRSRLRMMEEEVLALERSIDTAYNPYWGAMFREDNENSRFGEQVSDYADLYTSRASNFLAYSPLRYFRAPRVRMPHER